MRKENAMRLWLLRPLPKYLEYIPLSKDADFDNPWHPWYDCCFGLVVRARGEDRARLLARKDTYEQTEDRKNPWLDPEFTSCEPLTAAGEEGVIITDNHEA